MKNRLVTLIAITLCSLLIPLHAGDTKKPKNVGGALARGALGAVPGSSLIPEFAAKIATEFAGDYAEDKIRTVINYLVENYPQVGEPLSEVFKGLENHLTGKDKNLIMANKGNLFAAALIEAIKRGEEKEINTLLGEPSLNFNYLATDGDVQHSILHVAVEKNRPDIVQRILAPKREHAANPYQEDSDGNTALHIASKKSGTDSRIIDELIRSMLSKHNEAKLNPINTRGETPLHLAAAERFTGAIKKLLKNKAKLDIQDKDGQTPLHRAIKKSAEMHADVPTTTILSSDQVTPNIINIADHNKQTALYLAASLGLANIVSLLLEKGARNFAAEDRLSPAQIASNNRYNSIAEKINTYFSQQKEKEAIHSIKGTIYNKTRYQFEFFLGGKAASYTMTLLNAGATYSSPDLFYLGPNNEIVNNQDSDTPVILKLRLQSTQNITDTIRYYYEFTLDPAITAPRDLSLEVIVKNDKYVLQPKGTALEKGYSITKDLFKGRQNLVNIQPTEIKKIEDLDEIAALEPGSVKTQATDIDSPSLKLLKKLIVKLGYQPEAFEINPDFPITYLGFAQADTLPSYREILSHFVSLWGNIGNEKDASLREKTLGFIQTVYNKIEKEAKKAYSVRDSQRESRSAFIGEKGALVESITSGERLIRLKNLFDLTKAIKDFNKETAGTVVKNKIELPAEIDVNVQLDNEQGNRPLHLAVQLGDPVATRYLLQNKASIIKKNSNGDTPIHYFFTANKQLSNVEDQEVLRTLLLAIAPVKRTEILDLRNNANKSIRSLLKSRVETLPDGKLKTLIKKLLGPDAKAEQNFEIYNNSNKPWKYALVEILKDPTKKPTSFNTLEPKKIRTEKLQPRYGKDDNISLDLYIRGIEQKAPTYRYHFVIKKDETLYVQITPKGELVPQKVSLFSKKTAGGNTITDRNIPITEPEKVALTLKEDVQEVSTITTCQGLDAFGTIRCILWNTYEDLRAKNSKQNEQVLILPKFSTLKEETAERARATLGFTAETELNKELINEHKNTIMKKIDELKNSSTKEEIINKAKSMVGKSASLLLKRQKAGVARVSQPQRRDIPENTDSGTVVGRPVPYSSLRQVFGGAYMEPIHKPTVAAPQPQRPVSTSTDDGGAGVGQPTTQTTSEYEDVGY